MGNCPFCSHKYPVIYNDTQTVVVQTDPNRYLAAPKSHLQANPDNLACVGFLLNIPFLLGIKKARLIMNIDLETPDEHVHCEIIKVE